MIFAVLMTIGWGLISTGLSVLVMCIGRFLTGFAMGGNIHLAIVYVSEISEEKIRGTLTSITYIECGLGILLTYVFGTFYSWYTLSVGNIFFPVFVFICMYFMPESPTHLLNKGKTKEASESLMWLRGADNVEQIQDELDKLQASSQQPKGVEGESESVFKALFEKNNFKALILVLVLMMCQQLSGINAVLFYALTIFEASGTNLDSNICSIIIGFVIMLAVFLNGALIDSAGRRVLMFISQFGMAASLMSLGTYFYLKKLNCGESLNGVLSYIPLVSLISFVVFYNIGAGPIPFLYVSEVLSPKIKGVGCALAISFNWILAFLVTKYFVILTEVLDVHGCYFLFGIICLLGLVFCVAFLKETKGLSLDEIQKLYFSN